MVKFSMTAGGLDVFVNGMLFGHLQKGIGFFIGARVSIEYLKVSSDDLREIAEKAAEVKNRK